MTFKDQYQPAVWFTEHRRLSECLEMVMRFWALTAREIGNYRDSKFVNEYWRWKELERNSRNASTDKGWNVREMIFFIEFLQKPHDKLKRSHSPQKIPRDIRRKDLWSVSLWHRYIWDSEHRASRCLISPVTGRSPTLKTNWKIYFGAALSPCLQVVQNCTIAEIMAKYLTLKPG